MDFFSLIPPRFSKNLLEAADRVLVVLVGLDQGRHSATAAILRLDSYSIDTVEPGIAGAGQVGEEVGPQTAGDVDTEAVRQGTQGRVGRVLQN